MKYNTFSLNEILAIARIHPFYTAHVQYPPDVETIQAALDLAAADQSAPDLRSLPLTTKKDM